LQYFLGRSTIRQQGEGIISSIKNEDRQAFAHEGNISDSYDPGEARRVDAFFAKTSAPPSEEPSSGKESAFGKVEMHGLFLAGHYEEHKNKISYADRIKMDRFLALPEFRIKSHWQTLRSTLSFFSDPPDKACKFFVTKRLPEVCGVLEQLVTTARIILPRNDQNRSAWLRVHSPFSYNVLNVIRRWNISRIANLTGRLQSHPHGVYISDLKKLTQLIYRPIVILDAVDAERHIPVMVNKVYQLIYAEGDGVAFTGKQKKTIQNLTCQYGDVSGGVRYALYPLLMKLVCVKWYDYKTFFTEHRQRIYDFLDIKKGDCVIPPKRKEPVVSGNDKIEYIGKKADSEDPDEDNDERSSRQKLEQTLKNGLETLEILFPGSGWNRPQLFPDFYQYFAHIFNFEKTVQRIHPENPILQILVLSHILQDVFSGLRHVAVKPEDNADEPSLEKLMLDWQEAVEKLIYHDYFKLLTDYFDYFSVAAQFRKKSYGEKVANELHYFTKNFMLPFFDCSVEPKDIHFSVKDYGNLFSKIDALYKKFERIVSAPDKTAFIDNFSHPFVFDMPNSISKRLFSLFHKEFRTNEILITIAHEVTAVLHYLINSPDSWAYISDHRRKKFRSRDSAGLIPIEWRDQGLDPDNIFRQSIEILRREAAQKFKIEMKVPD
jgi:hypothetical protein